MKLPHLRSLVALTTILILIAGFLMFHSSAVPAKPEKLPAPLVSLTTATVTSLPLTLTTQGHVVSLNQVDIQSQITGTVRAVAFQEGAFVQQGQLLFTLDDATQRATLLRDQASRVQVQALLDKAERDLMRGRSLKAQNYISASDWDTLLSTRQQYAAQLLAAQEDIHSAQAQLGYTRIYAPVSGKTGTLNVHPGSLVQPGSSQPLVTVSQFDPIGITFTLPEQDLNAVLSARTQGSVTVRIHNARGQNVAGVLDFIDNTVNTGSGTISLKARCSNAEHLLWPGSFQNIRVEAGAEKVVILPPQAVQNGPEGHFVYLVDSHNLAILKPVELLRIQQQMAIVKGLTQGTRVVAEGSNNLRPGMQVAVAQSQTTLMEKNP